MRGLAACATLLLFGLLAAPAAGGGWATTSLSSLPDGTAPGEPWVVDITVLAHGVNPLTGVRPSVHLDGGPSFAAMPTAKPGVYRARVVFPHAGRWRYEVETGFGDTLTYAPVQIADAAAPGGDDSSAWRWLAALGAGLLAAFGVVALTRRRGSPAPTPAPAP